MGEVRAVLVGFGALGVGRGGVCKVCEVCEGEMKGWAVLEVGRKYLCSESESDSGSAVGTGTGTGTTVLQTPTFSFFEIENIKNQGSDTHGKYPPKAWQVPQRNYPNL